MSFLNNTGLAYFYSKLKEKFIQSVNGLTPDTHGNVQINQVPLAENLTSPDAQASIDTFVYRTSGGSASLDNGEANLVFVNGNITITGRVIENWSATASEGLACNVNNINKTTWRSQVSTTGTTTFTYSTVIADENVSNWTSTASWSPALASYGVNDAISGVINYSIACSIGSSTGITGATINPTTFSATTFGAVNTTVAFIYNVYEDDVETEEEDESEKTGWYYDTTKILLTDYGITTTGTPVQGDTITITWAVGTPSNSIVNITYTAPVQGTLNVATPKAFQSTGFNQFDKTTMVINNATINRISGQVIENLGTYLCYCPSKGGDHGYAAVSLSNYINTTGGMGWCATVPTIGSDVVLTSINTGDSISTYSGRFTYNEDGYTLIVVDDPSDLMMGCAWSDYISDIQESNTYVDYTLPSQIPIPMYGYDSDNQRVQLPTASYGLPRLGNVYDTINFDASTYIKRIGQLGYSASNLITVENYYSTYGTPYDYDDTNIFYVLDGNAGNDPVVYNLETVGSYTASSGAITNIDFDKFIINALPNILAYDNIMHDTYTFTNTGSGNTSWSYTWNDGTTHSQTFIFDTNWGVTFGSVSSGNTMTLYLPITSIYQVDDHGTEKFTGTNVAAEAELLYGQNLRDKLRTDVVTISAQELLPSQQSQIRTNIQATPIPLVFTNVAVTSSMFAADTTYNDFSYCGTIALSGVTSNMIPYVAFNGNEASSGDYCPTVATYDGGIYIYANASSDITIPTIMCWRLD